MGQITNKISSGKNHLQLLQLSSDMVTVPDEQVLAPARLCNNVDRMLENMSWQA